MDISIWITIGIIAVLLLCSAFFSMCETAVTAASRPRLYRLSQQGNRRAQTISRLREHQDRLIGAILLGNNLVNIAASAMATGVLIALVGEAGVAYAAFAMTALIFVFGEALPKSLAIFRPVRTALAVAPALNVAVIVFAPVTHSVQVLVRFILRQFGIRWEAGINAAVVEEELRGSIDLHADFESETPHKREMLHSVLDLPDVTVGDIMTHRKDVMMVDGGDRPRAVVEKVLASPYTRVPVWRGEPDNITGILHAKAVLRAVIGAGSNAAAIDPMSLATRPWFIPDTTSLLDQLQAFRRRREHFAVVVDEYGSFMGIVTLEDIVEEIVGDIFDEHEIPVPGVRQQPDGSLIIRGTATLRELNRQYNWKLPEDEASTIAGLVIREARIIPEPGQVFEFHGLRFEILRRQRNQITSIRVARPIAEPAAQPDAAAS
ncbi:MAG: HlyC/CorC family transporter [Alphaproteobacteria bacterium]